MTGEQQKQELYKTLWNIAEELRGKMDGWDFKQYILGILCYRFMSEHLTQYVNAYERENGNETFDYVTFNDEEARMGKEGIVEALGYFIAPSELFCNIVKKIQTDKRFAEEQLNEYVGNAFRNLEASIKGQPSEAALSGLFDELDFSSKKLGNKQIERNKKLADIFRNIAEVSLGEYRATKIDVFGDAYEYLIAMYASQAGKSGGEYFTPQEVSDLLVRLATLQGNIVENMKVYDPCCGSGSLLLRFQKLLGENASIEYFGQESNPTTYNLCRMNMILHGVPFTDFHIAQGDTLLHPFFKEKKFHIIVSNPPYSLKWEGNSNPLFINDERFSPAGVLAPKKAADMAFLMHIVYYLAPGGAGAVVMPEGVLFRVGAEQAIRKYLVESNCIDGIIAMPEDIFFGTTIKTCIVVLKKGKKDTTIFFVDASREYSRVNAKNVLQEEHRNKILDAYKKKEEIPGFSKCVEMDTIRHHHYDLTVSTYVKTIQEKPPVDIETLERELEASVARQQTLRNKLASVLQTYKEEFYTKKP